MNGCQSDGCWVLAHVHASQMSSLGEKLNCNAAISNILQSQFMVFDRATRQLIRAQDACPYFATLWMKILAREFISAIQGSFLYLPYDCELDTITKTIDYDLYHTSYMSVFFLYFLSSAHFSFGNLFNAGKFFPLKTRFPIKHATAFLSSQCTFALRLSISFPLSNSQIEGLTKRRKIEIFNPTRVLAHHTTYCAPEPSAPFI